MYIDYYIRRPSLRETTMWETVQLKNVNQKKLKMMNKEAYKQYNNAKYHGGRMILGGSVGSWLKNKFRKVKKIAKNAYNKVIKPVYNKVIKPGIDFLASSDIGKTITSTAANVIGSAVSAIPVVGPIAGPVVKNTLPAVVDSAKNITDAAEKVVEGIRNKNPQVSVSQAKEIVNTIKKTYGTLSDEIKKEKEEQTKKALEELPDVVKAEGFTNALKAAPFLPLLDLNTLREENTTTKGGKLKIAYKVRKPRGADNFGKYSAPIVGRVAGRIYLGGRNLKTIGDDARGINKELEMGGKCGGKTMKNKNSKTLDLLESLRKKYNK